MGGKGGVRNKDLSETRDGRVLERSYSSVNDCVNTWRKMTSIKLIMCSTTTTRGAVRTRGGGGERCVRLTLPLACPMFVP